ncbi:MAG: TrbC/VirB2 family protein [Rhodothermaceae bacterium]|nr:TrbC/VirB2 family protein [Rhodothermaceae bacterium]MXX59837.1 TrbC/VirB2 family protein [Rhodothermaceae bacterium]MYD20471.1 TrbC/VirB2 family protein [Rhodothermaceae bacterium]MYD55962.1 TrbC/VirB2 family protein [Rhodothermaceae bacterium]MYI42675.1 TrbC/VirB2 family protein [Rhodothermaceae bacterium]
MHTFIQRAQYLLVAIATTIVLFPVVADASGIGGVRVATSTVSKIVGLLTGDLATAAFLLIIVLGGLAWWITRSSRAGEILGRTVLGAVIIFGAAQISDFFSFQGALI